ncbi:MAG: DUF4956 domain-containing protein [Oscillospiraceae bacterium]|jgi:type III secretory pathway component EscS|nr:DUF4956 domain-containing protein [Oscillospiraceae bacterium]
MFESIFASTDATAPLTLVSLLLAVGAALVLGLLVSIVNIKTHKQRPPTQSFSLTLVILPAIVTVIIMLIGNSVARAFSLAGAFQIIRFRSAPGDPKDIAYVLFTMAVGLCCGMGYLLFGAAAAVILCAAMAVLEAAKFGREKDTRRLLKITVPENLDYQTAFDDVLQKHTASYTRRRVKTADLGSLFELQYSLTTKPGIDEKAFIDDLRCRNGNLNITLVLDANDSEF